MSAAKELRERFIKKIARIAEGKGIGIEEEEGSLIFKFRDGLDIIRLTDIPPRALLGGKEGDIVQHVQESHRNMAEIYKKIDTDNFLGNVFFEMKNIRDIGDECYIQVAGDLALALILQFSTENGIYYFYPTQKMIERWGQEKLMDRAYQNMTGLGLELSVPHGLPPQFRTVKIFGSSGKLSKEAAGFLGTESSFLISDSKTGIGVSLILWDQFSGQICRTWKNGFLFVFVTETQVLVVKNPDASEAAGECIRQIKNIISLTQGQYPEKQPRIFLYKKREGYSMLN